MNRCRPNSGHGAFNQMAMHAKVLEALKNPTAGAEQMDICFLQSYLTSCESARAFIPLSHNTPPPPHPLASAEAWHLFTKAHSRDQTAELWSLLTGEISVALHPIGYSSTMDASIHTAIFTFPTDCRNRILFNYFFHNSLLTVYKQM